MGGTSYSFSARSARAEELGYLRKSSAEIFTQTKARSIHESMDPKKIRLREARDSDVHPFTLPVYFCMDITGSMSTIPHEFIKDGLPKMISEIIQRGIPSPALLFSAVGDSETGDKAPFQVGQFESGDVEMDKWLERVWPEGGGGSNGGESYSWPWFFTRYIVTDAWEKRKQKGILVTYGDEPCLPQISKHEFKEVMGLEQASTLKSLDLLKEAQEKWHVFHIHDKHRGTPPHWKEWLGQNLIEVDTFHEVPKIVADLCYQHCDSCHTGARKEPAGEHPRDGDESIHGGEEEEII